MQHLRRTRAQGQSLVEFALAAIILFVLLSAAVDAGLIFLSYQKIVNAAKEGLTYGAYRPVLPDPSNPGAPIANDENIRYRVRYSSGDPAGQQASVGFVNLLDLNNNGVLDDAEGGYTPTGVIAQNIAINAYQDGAPTTNCINRDRNCWIRITIRYNYRLVFPLAPVFGNTLTIQVVRDQQIIRSSL